MTTAVGFSGRIANAPSSSTSVVYSDVKLDSSGIRYLVALLGVCPRIRGGGDEDTPQQQQQQYEMLSDPAPGSPFHHAFPVHDLNLAKEFYGNVLGCKEGRSSEKWQDYSLHGHQIVCHWVGNDYRCNDYYNRVDGDEVPFPHFGLALTVDQFQELADHLQANWIVMWRFSVMLWKRNWSQVLPTP